MNSGSIHIVPNGVEDRSSQRVSSSLGSFGLALLIIGGAFFYPIIKEAMKKEPEPDKIHVQAKKVINYSQLSAPPPIDIEKPEPETFKTPPKAKQTKFIQPVAKKDEEVLEEEYIPTMDELQETQISTIDAEGADSVVVDIEASIEAPEEEPAEVLSFVEQMPTFKGGDAALMSYLGKNLQYPDLAKDMDVQGVVFVRFVVEPDGSINEVTVIRGVFDALDREAIRVIKEMPQWNPGLQNGRAVRVYYTIPIRFELR